MIDRWQRTPLASPGAYNAGIRKQLFNARRRISGFAAPDTRHHTTATPRRAIFATPRKI
ncbi:hypothetical protein MW397_24135 (plasmid) [Escherichia coli]|nr:hypothetical protein [Escherichia coli]WAH15651.1 hypothetical protein MW397_24135 [Escherichia coli]